MKKGAIFNKVVLSAPKRNKFDLSHDRKFSCDMGRLYPSLNQEAYPSDEWSIDGQSLVRTAPMVAPMMHQVNIYKHYFFVPNRILWSNWDAFITGGDKFNSDAPTPIPPTVKIPAGGFKVGTIPDYLGFPTGLGDSQDVSALPFAAYYRTYQEHYASQAFQDTDLFMLTDGDNTAAITALGLFGVPFNVNWEPDYFTAALPEPQKGPEVTIPLGDTAPLKWKDDNVGQQYAVDNDNDSIDGSVNQSIIIADSDGRMKTVPAGDNFNINITTTHEVDLSAATSATVNSWRLAMAVQKLYERLARGGSRPIEFLRNVWNSRASSSRLDRPEYIGGAKEPLSVSEVLQTSETDNSPQGNMAGHGVAVARINHSTYSVQEYGIIQGFFFVRPKAAYFQGIPKAWLRIKDRFDYFFPDLAHIGEQPVYNMEVYAQHATLQYSGPNWDTFGYLPYGTELRYINDSIHGEFRTTQDFWHMGRKFSNPPALNELFLRCDPTRRVFADVSGETDTLYCHLYHKITAKRCIPLFGTPS